MTSNPAAITSLPMPSAGMAAIRCSRISLGISGCVVPFDQNGAKIVDVGKGGTGDDEIVEPAEEAVAVIVGKQRFGTEAASCRPHQRIGPDDGAGIVLGAVDAVGIGRQRMD